MRPLPALTSCPASTSGNGPALTVVPASGIGDGVACFETVEGLGTALFFEKGGRVYQMVVTLNVSGVWADKGPSVDAAEKALAFDAMARL